jgi:hypothetical protein
MTMARSTRSADWQGMNWIRQDKRLAIYLRDGLACVWCGQAVEDGIKLTLDHIIPDVDGGENGADNLVCACHGCNSRRADRPVAEFAAAVAGYVNHGVTAEDILADIANRTAQPLKKFRAEAKDMIARRGSAARAIAAL